MWLEKTPGDPRLRDDETLYYDGQLWFYAYSPETRQLRRTSKADPRVHDLLRIRKLPTSPLDLTQRFYERRKKVHPKLDRRPLRARGPSAKWYSRRKPVVAVWAPESLDLPQLQAVYDRLLPARPRAFTQRETVLVRVRAMLEERGLRLVNLVPPGSGGITVTPQMHIVPAGALPDHTIDYRDLRRSPFLDTDVIRLLRTENPKRHGSASWLRYQTYRDGMTVGEYAGMHGRNGRLDVVHDWDHQYIAVLREGQPIT